MSERRERGGYRYPSQIGPLCSVVSRSPKDMRGWLTEHLDCGHTLWVYSTAATAKRRRCPDCGRRDEDTERALALTHGEVL